MKTKTVQFLFAAMLLISAFMHTACTQDRTITKNYRMPAFTAIESNSAGNIFFRQGNTTSVRAEGNEDLLDKLKVSVLNGVLMIDMEERTWKRFKNKKNKLTIFITSPSLEALELNGVGNIKLEGTVNTPRIEIESDGVGNLAAENLVCDHIILTSDGVGNLRLAGTTNTISITSDGVGNIHAEHLIAHSADVISNGVGNVRFHAAKTADVSANGIGNVSYYGNPETKNIRKNGLGKVKPGN